MIYWNQKKFVSNKYYLLKINTNICENRIIQTLCAPLRLAFGLLFISSQRVLENKTEMSTIWKLSRGKRCKLQWEDLWCFTASEALYFPKMSNANTCTKIHCLLKMQLHLDFGIFKIYSLFFILSFPSSPWYQTEAFSLSYLYPTETGLYLQLLHQFPGLADTHGAVHWGVSFHPTHKHSGIYGSELNGTTLIFCILACLIFCLWFLWIHCSLIDIKMHNLLKTCFHR